MTKRYVDYDYETDNIVCPVCDKILVDIAEGTWDMCDHVVLTYSSMIGEIVEENANGLVISEKIEKLINEDEDIYLEDAVRRFVEETEGYDLLEWTETGMACGPVSNTTLMVIERK